MNDQQLKSFIVAAEEGSLSKAAARSYVSVPSFSQRIQTLERELGFALFARSAQGVTLTPAGESFLQTARTVVSVYEDGLARAVSLARNRVRVGHLSNEPFPSFFPGLINYFARSFPDIEVVFRFAAESTWVEGVRDGLSDVCFATPPSDDATFENLRFIHLFDDPVYLCVSPASPVADCTEVGHGALDGATVYIQPDYRGLPSFEALFALAEEGATVVEAEFSKELIMRVVMEGHGVIPLPGQYFASCCPPLVPVRLSGDTIDQGVIYRADASQPVLDFVACAERYFQEEGSALLATGWAR
ncbi:LysR family transcriptional regulator [Adlercreutzia sp. R25]|uniref:LysR family transcriptional regulator n=1 Tax=Adlercreutzia shanghongiae TaxID=3111773 RepID=UPI002DC05621|nr:LysR family transcriptional regulator [Adlercreutzia sp. R25]MEC4271863.1 LysR family transcriptional regulator [Adlercreutzia sp. R25]